MGRRDSDDVGSEVVAMLEEILLNKRDQWNVDEY